MLVWSVVLVSDEQQSDSIIYVCVCILFQDFSMIGCYKILTIVPCAVQYILAAYFIDSSAIDTS